MGTMLKVIGFIGAVASMPIVAQMDASTAMERMAKGTTQTVLAVVVIALAVALLKVYKLHRQDALDSRKELKDEFERHAKEQKDDNEKLQHLLAESTSAMNMQSKSNDQLKEAIYHLSSVVEKNGGTIGVERKG